MKVEFIKPEETYTLRHGVLRPHQKLEDCHYPGDHTSTTFHLGVKQNSIIASIGTFYLEKHTAFKEDHQYRLRGMATNPELRGQGLAMALIKEGERILKQRGATLLWCYAREKAFGFYSKAGLKFHGDFFELPGIGLHKVMYKPI